MMFNMMLGTGILIGTVVTVVTISILWYRSEEKKRSE